MELAGSSWIEVEHIVRPVQLLIVGPAGHDEGLAIAFNGQGYQHAEDSFFVFEGLLEEPGHVDRSSGSGS